MSKSYLVLGDPALQEGAPRCNGRVLALLSLFIGVSCVALWTVGGGQHLAVEEPINAMALSYMPTSKTSQYAGSPLQHMQRALPMAGSRPQFRSMAAPVQAMPDKASFMASAAGQPPQLRSVSVQASSVQDALKSYGIGSSAVEKLAIAAIDANNRGSGLRNVVAMASKLDEQTKVRLSAVEEEVEIKAQELAGITAPTGFFDPLGFAADIPAGTLLFFREAELKHGRVGMLASLGLLVGEKFHPLFGGNIDVPGYLAFQQTPLQTFWPAVLVAMAIPEFYSILSFDQPFDRFSGYALKKGWSIKTNRVPGDLGYDPLGLKPKDPKEFLTMQNKEINNGRLAMLAAAGMLAQELATGQKVW